ncbi:MAG: helix-turn-helix domain-containing protein [Desulfurococcales archaeon]|nr:helix-turn-helix domain-containing protein [Desulfurococcales archaeon]
MRKGRFGPELTLSMIRVYAIFLREARPLGVRELQRLAGFKSPSTAKYHIDRLVELGLLRPVPEGYVASGEKPYILSVYMALGGYLVPRIVPLGVFTMAYSLAYSLLVPEVAPVLAPILVAGFLVLAEGVRLARLIPWKRRSTA